MKGLCHADFLTFMKNKKGKINKNNKKSARYLVNFC